MDRGQLETQRECAATDAQAARARIEAAVGCGELPRWVLDACDALERSAFAYAIADTKLQQPPVTRLAAPSRLH